MWSGIDGAYVAWDTGQIIIEYLQANDDQWPQSWEDLLSVREKLDEDGERLRGTDSDAPLTYGNLPESVIIDWDIDPDEIREAKWGEKITTRMVLRSDGKKFPMTWEGAEPNRMIWEYFHREELD